MPSEVILTLATRPDRLARDLGVFRRVAASLKTCSSVWTHSDGRPSFTVGAGGRCPTGAHWF